MTQEEKQLLLKDLCARLPYGVKVTNGIYTITLKVRIDTAPATLAQFVNSDDLKYYLRPMESMTDEEKIELKEYLDAEEVDCNGFGYIEGGTLEDYVSRVTYSLCNYVIDWLNAHHFDYRGLVKKGLALEAPEGMYNI